MRERGERGERERRERERERERERRETSSYQSRISRAERLFNYDVIDSHAVGCNSNKQNDPIDDALRGHHALASLPAGI